MTDGLTAAVPADAVPDGDCVAAADGEVLLTRVDGDVHAYRNRCLHKEEPLDAGTVKDGILTCPAHFWRYRLDNGRRVGHLSSLQRLPCEIRDGIVYVAVPGEDIRSIREVLLSHARDWRRDR